MFRFTTAGESHGRGLVAVLEGIPAGLPLSAERINAELKRRMGGYGRGARMKIEADQIEWLAGVRAGETLGSPIAMLVWNRDWEHWQDVMAPEADAPGSERRRQVTRPRPGHADLAGSLKYDRQDARDILERASARETVARVACGAVCKVLLEQFGVEVGSHVVELGGVSAKYRSPLPSPLNEAADASPVRCLDPAAEQEMIARIDAAKAAGATLGAGGDEADLDADVAAAHGGPDDGRAGASAVGALGRDGRAGDGRHRRGDGGPDAGPGDAREIRRRCTERDETELRGVCHAGARAYA